VHAVTMASWALHRDRQVLRGPEVRRGGFPSPLLCLQPVTWDGFLGLSEQGENGCPCPAGLRTSWAPHKRGDASATGCVRH
jgi:hypothetical protein